MVYALCLKMSKPKLSDSNFPRLIQYFSQATQLIQYIFHGCNHTCDNSILRVTVTKKSFSKLPIELHNLGSAYQQLSVTTTQKHALRHNGSAATHREPPLRYHRVAQQNTHAKLNSSPKARQPVPEKQHKKQSAGRTRY